MRAIDLNCDMGEGCPNDAELMRYISSANVACGFHAGDVDTMRRTVDLAMEHGVAIGAHPGYADRANFGRLPMSLGADEVRSLVTEQLEVLRGVCSDAGTRISHVKPHGALYNQAARNAGLAAAIATAVRDFDPTLVLFGLSGSLCITEAEKLAMATASEVFADRTYQADGSLTPRTEANALITDTRTAAAQAFQMVNGGTVTATDGSSVSVKADTICIHGDGPHAVAFAAAINALLRDNGTRIRPFEAARS